MTLDLILIIAIGVTFFLMLCFILYIRHKRVKLKMTYVDKNNDGLTVLEEAEKIIEEYEKEVERESRRIAENRATWFDKKLCCLLSKIEKNHCNKSLGE